MPVTTMQVAEQALRELVAVGVGQAASADDAAAINVMACLATLAAVQAADLVADAQNEAIGDEYLLPLARYCAGRAGPSFGMGIGEAYQMQQVGEREIRVVSSSRIVIDPVRADYF